MCSSDLEGSATSDIETIASIFSQGLFTIIADLFKMTVILLVMIVVSVRLTIVVLLIFPFLIYATRLFQKAMKKAFELVRSEVASVDFDLSLIMLRMFFLSISIKKCYGF